MVVAVQAHIMLAHSRNDIPAATPPRIGTRGVMEMTNVLVLGGYGLLGEPLCNELEASGFEVFRPSRREVDVTSPRSLRDYISKLPDVDVDFNCAAYTDEDRAESEPKLAEAVNAEGAGNVAAACSKAGGFLVHVSTDYVFDGRSDRPYREEDPTNPLQVYGRTKLEGERRVAQEAEGYVIVRTQALFGPGPRPDFVKKLLDRAQNGLPLQVVADQVTAPTYAPFLAKALASLPVKLGYATWQDGAVLQAAGTKGCSWYELASAVHEW